MNLSRIVMFLVWTLGLYFGIGTFLTSTFEYFVLGTLAPLGFVMIERLLE